MKNRKIFVQRKIQKKSDFVVKGFINDITKLEYFFEKFFEFTNNSGRYPSLEKWRENLVTELLENLTENEITDFDIGEIFSTKTCDKFSLKSEKFLPEKIFKDFSILEFVKLE